MGLFGTFLAGRGSPSYPGTALRCAGAESGKDEGNEQDQD
jgi:hypothetical protein